MARLKAIRAEPVNATAEPISFALRGLACT